MLARPCPPEPGHDYADCCEVRSASGRTAEEWLRAMFEAAPRASRLALRAGWTVLTVRRPGGPRSVLGWPLVADGPHRAVLRTSSRVGLRPDLVLTRDAEVVRFESHLGLETPAARAVWAAVGGPHRLIVRYLLGRAAIR